MVCCFIPYVRQLNIHSLFLCHKSENSDLVPLDHDFEIVKGNLKKNCHKREILGYPSALPPADSDTIYSFSGQSRL